MSYLTFHLTFIVPPILLLLALFARRRPWNGTDRWTIGAIALIALIALIHTTPWDNQLVRMGVWTYGPDRVIGTIGYVPVEEYAFFVLQPLMIGLWLHAISADTDWARLERGPLRPRLIVAAAAMGIGLATVLAALRWESLTYAGFILGWTLPAFALQWGWGGGIYAGMARTMSLGVAVPTLYLWIADRIAIGQGIWAISPRHTIGLNPFGLPIEEALFFLVINVLVVQGLVAVIWIGQRLPERRRAPAVADQVPTAR